MSVIALLLFLILLALLWPEKLRRGIRFGGRTVWWVFKVGLQIGLVLGGYALVNSYGPPLWATYHAWVHDTFGEAGDMVGKVMWTGTVVVFWCFSGMLFVTGVVMSVQRLVGKGTLSRRESLGVFVLTLILGGMFWNAYGRWDATRHSRVRAGQEASVKEQEASTGQGACDAPLEPYKQANKPIPFDLYASVMRACERERQQHTMSAEKFLKLGTRPSP
jgi:hypothetical protein